MSASLAEFPTNLVKSNALHNMVLAEFATLGYGRNLMMCAADSGADLLLSWPKNQSGHAWHLCK